MSYKILLLVGIGFNVLAQLLLKQGTHGLDILARDGLASKLKEMALNPVILLALLSYGVGFIVYAIVLSKINLNVAYPIASTLAIVTIYLFSVSYFNESTNTMAILGIILCVVGIALLLK